MIELTAGLICILMTICLACYYLTNNRHFRLPPGPPSDFIVGSVRHMTTPVWRWAYTNKAKYGDIIYYKIGQRDFIILNSYEMAREAFIIQSERFSGRPLDALSVSIRGEINGLVMEEGNIWLQHRRFSLRVLRDLGFGKNLSQEHIQQEITCLYKTIDKKIKTEKSIDFGPCIATATANVINKFVFGERLDEKDKFQEKLDIINRITQNEPKLDAKSVFMLYLLRFVIKIPLAERCLVGDRLKNVRQDMLAIRDYLSEKIEIRKRSYNITHEPSNFVEAYLKEISTGQEEGGFTEKRMPYIIFDLFLAGTDTTATTLRWALLLLAMNQDVQKRLQAQIEQTIGQERLPSMNDRRHLPLVEAVIEETSRMASLVPQNVHHKVTENARIGGFDVPKNTVVLTNIYAIHHNEKEFEEPNAFIPERFIVNGAFKNHSHVMPFSMGKRICLGESLARMELFLFVTAIFQRYHVNLSEDDVANGEILRSGGDGFVRAPIQHKLVFTLL